MDSEEPVLESPGLFRQPWYGESKVVIGVDLGTTKSGIAFAFFERGQVPELHRVTHWPGQGFERQAKIPTTVWYDMEMKATSFGAEASQAEIEEQAEDNGWMLAKHFKLHLFPENMKSCYSLRLDALPLGVSLLQIYTDYLRYLLVHTQAFFEDRILDGRAIWARYKPEMELVITHPNGWGIREQAFLQRSAVGAGYVGANEDASTKIHFLSEAEASVYFCLYHTNLWSRIKDETTFLVCDAGGATVDIAVFTIVSIHPTPTMEEKKTSACIQAGAVFVNMEFERYLRQTLSRAGLPVGDIDDYTKRGVSDFENYVKRAFLGNDQGGNVSLGNLHLNNTSIGVRRGRVALSGALIKSCFDICVPSILAAVDEQMNGLNVSHLLLVGGFGDSPYLRQEFKKRYEPRGCQVTLANDSSSKAVADGAVLWKIVHTSISRSPRESWGIETSIVYDHNDPEHQKRADIAHASDCTVVVGRWKNLVKKGVPLDDAHAVVTIPFSFEYPSPSAELGKFELDLYRYSGDDKPVWMRTKQGKLLPKFRKAAVIQTELENLRGALESQIALGGILQWQLDFEVCIRFSGKELKAHLEWKDKGDKRTYPCAFTPSPS